MEFDLENPLPTSKDKLPSLFNIENEHMPSKNYLQSLNSADFAMSIREEIVSSILHLSRDFDPFSSYLAINYMDRFLSTHSIPVRHLYNLQIHGFALLPSSFFFLIFIFLWCRMGSHGSWN